MWVVGCCLWGSCQIVWSRLIRRVVTGSESAFVGCVAFDDANAATETLTNLELAKHEADKDLGVTPADCASIMLTCHLRNHGHTLYMSRGDGDLADASAATLPLSALGRATRACLAGTSWTADDVGEDIKSAVALALKAPLGHDYACLTEDAFELMCEWTCYPPEYHKDSEKGKRAWAEGRGDADVVC